MQLKYCGNRSLADLQISVSSCAHYIGLVFAKSKREVRAHEVSEWLKTISLNGKKLVGVFVNASLEEITAVIRDVPLSVIQCHGNETPEHVRRIKEVTQIPVWKAIHHGADAVTKMKAFSGIANGYVIDSKVAESWGGTGVAFDWNFIPHYLAEAKAQKVPCFIAGGIRPENIDLLLRFAPDGIDISSGVEKHEAKNKQKMELIEKKVKEYESYAG